MPVFVEASGGRPLWARKQAFGSGNETVRIALVNNMPDAALEDTETQFFDLLSEAAQGLSVHMKLVSLPNVPRGERGLERLQQLYYGVDELWNHSYDAIIVTGTEPKYADLRQEPYWDALASLFEWAQHNTISTVLSCLAAHAAVLHSDGIARVRLDDKMFGVFEFTKASDHPLTSRSEDVLRFPHSRWNGLPAAALVACGYQLLTRNGKAGADCFVKRKEQSLMVHFQGHPEYQTQTLFKEYRRDIRRYLRQERETYPTAPVGYFGEEASRSLADFREKAAVNRSEEIMRDFPESFLTSNLQNAWRTSAVKIYSNWLHLISEKKAETFNHARVGLRRSGNTLQWLE